MRKLRFYYFLKAVRPEVEPHHYQPCDPKTWWPQSASDHIADLIRTTLAKGQRGKHVHLWASDHSPWERIYSLPCPDKDLVKFPQGSCYQSYKVNGNFQHYLSELGETRWVQPAVAQASECCFQAAIIQYENKEITHEPHVLKICKSPLCLSPWEGNTFHIRSPH